MTLIADENLHVHIVQALRDKGYEVLSIRELRPSIADIDVLEFARANQGVVMTEDKDFGELAFRDGHHDVGIILLRLSTATVEEKINLLLAAISLGHDLATHMTVISEKQTRLRVLR